MNAQAASVADEQAQPLDRIGDRYQIESTLGSGGMGTVLAGRDLLLDRPVAIKVLPLDKRQNERATQRLHREARAMARIAHPGVVQVFDHGNDARLGPYIIMERLFGKDLSQLMHDRAPLELSLAIRLIEQACAALQAAHAAGVVHRDLKPSNLFVVHGPAMLMPRIKVLDFGVAKLDDPGQLTDPGDILGTLAYLPPERWEAGEVADARGDIYALGAIVYQMLSGFAPFRAGTRAALRLSILHDDVASLSIVRPELPSALAAAVSRALSKSPADRFENAWEFALALGVPPQRLEPSAAEGEAAGPFEGTARYRVQRLLARGQGTEVYAAWDIERNRSVALKRLLAPNGESLSRLKREFRALTDISQRNVARAYEFVEQGENVLLALELVDGIPLLDYLQSAPSELHSCLCQLVYALAAVHARGLVHGDVTPQNVLVEPGGRVVLFDCGLSSRARERATPRGTREYLAPEVFSGVIGPEADFYSLGVLLFRAITGELPGAPPPGLSLRDWLYSFARPEWSPELLALCLRLLDPDPNQRAAEASSLAKLGILAEVHSASLLSTQSGRFVGRGAALADLWDAFRASAEGTSTVIWLQGTSGIGKTTLLEHFGRTLEEQGRALVLRSRARHSVSIPFPAFDEFIDELSEWLTLQTPAALAALLPRNTEQLARLFPVLLRIPAIARSVTSAADSPDAAQARLQATDALRELARRLCLRQPLVLLIDDVQWLDGDSAELLAAVLRAPEPPPLLLIGAVRTDAGELGPSLRRLETRLREPARRLHLEPLSNEEAHALVRARWRGNVPLEAPEALRLARQSGGNPFFADLLAEGLLTPNAGGRVGLDSVLRARHERLPASSRLALELLCVASRPLRRSVLAQATGNADPLVLEALSSGRFVRAAHTAGDALEPYHARIRDAVLQSLPATLRRAHHSRLADTLRRDGGAEPEALVEHLAGSGDTHEAAGLAVAAAQTASEQLAFDRAAALFGVALEHGQFGAAEAQAIQRRRARALQDAGRRREAGKQLLSSAELATTEDQRSNLRREAGSHLLLSGDSRLGLEVLAPSISAAGLSLPETPADTVVATIGALQALAVRGMSWVPAHATAATHDELERIDLCLLLAQGLAHVDLRALPFAILAFHRALDAGESERLQRASALFVVSTVGHVPNPLTGPGLELCRQLTGELQTPYARALLLAAEGEMALSQGKFLAAEANFERAERTLLESCVGATRELAVVRDMAVFIQYAHKGDFRTQLVRTQRWMREAEETQDQFHASMLRVAHAIVWIAHDRPEHAQSELDRAEAEWTGAAGILVVVATLYRDIVDRYLGTDRAEQEQRLFILASPAAQTPFLAGYVALHTIWSAIRTIARIGSRAEEELRIASESLSKLRSFGLDIWVAVADALEANLDYLRGAREAALQRLEEAEQTFRRLHMLCFAACARKRRGQFTHAEFGARLQLEAGTQLQQLGIVDVERWSRAYWSVFETDLVQPLTYVNDQEGSLSASDGF
ncbi:MAG TPA: protein kinase [Polyangiaceae bacterium]